MVIRSIDVVVHSVHLVLALALGVMTTSRYMCPGGPSHAVTAIIILQFRAPVLKLARYRCCQRLDLN
jgi:hypothetical protein